MSSVPISKAYVSKRSNRVKSNPKWTSSHNQIKENNTSRLSPPESRKYRLSETFGSDCKVSVLWDASAVRLYVETRKWWTERQQIGWLDQDLTTRRDVCSWDIKFRNFNMYYHRPSGVMFSELCFISYL